MIGGYQQPGDKNRDFLEYSLEGKTQRLARKGHREKTCRPLRNPLQKSWRYQKIRGISGREQIPQVNVRIGHGSEASESKHPKCWDTPCKNKQQWSESRLFQSWKETNKRIIHLTHQPQESLRWQANDNKCGPSKRRVRRG